MNRVTLYIATHNKTGKKYFGKTITCFTEEELQIKYHGSGKHWRGHLKKFGDDVTMKIFKICSLNENDKDFVKPIALRFSEENDIVNSKEWANMMAEDGLGGWPVGENNPSHFLTEEQNKKKGNWIFAKNYLELIKIRSKNVKGEKNPMFGKNFQTHGLKKRGKFLKGKTYEEIFGNEKAKNIKKTLSISQTGKQHNLISVKCPHCCLVGKGPNMSRYHFDNCYLNEENKNNKIGHFSENKDLRQEMHICFNCGKNIRNIGNLNRWHNENCRGIK
jgi:hypothetical protein